MQDWMEARNHNPEYYFMESKNPVPAPIGVSEQLICWSVAASTQGVISSDFHACLTQENFSQTSVFPCKSWKDSLNFSINFASKSSSLPNCRACGRAWPSYVSWFISHHEPSPTQIGGQSFFGSIASLSLKSACNCAREAVIVYKMLIVNNDYQQQGGMFPSLTFTITNPCIKLQLGLESIALWSK